MVDELLYATLARSFAEHGHFLLRGVAYGGVGKVYPLVISPAWLFGSASTAYAVAKTLNAVVMSLAAVPAYLWARRLVSPALAVVAAALVLLVPGYVYTGSLMTENAFFPAFVLASFLIALALERPTLLAQALALGSVALATAVRVQGLVLAGALVLAVGIKVLLDLRVGAGRARAPALILPYVPMLAVLALAAVGYAAWKAAKGAGLSSGLGAYSAVTAANYSWQSSARWVLQHLGELSLAVGIVPLAALAVLAGLAAVRGLPGAAERAFVAVAVPAVVLVVIQVGVFASRFSFRIEERNMFCVAPLLLLALVVWIGRGLPRPPIFAVPAALGSAALVLAIPLAARLNYAIDSDTFGLIPLFRLLQPLSGDVGEVRWIMILGAFDAALAFLLVPRRIAAVALPVALAAYFAVVTTAVSNEVTAYAERVRATVPGDPSWIDRSVGSDASVSYLFGASAEPFHEGVVLWQLEFWNRSLDGVYNLGVPSPSGLPDVPARIDGATGRIVSDSPELAATRYVAADARLAVAARPLRRNGDVVLYAARRPLGVTDAVTGVYADGVMGSDASYDRYRTPGGRAGTAAVSVSREPWGGQDRPGRVLLEVGPLARGPDGSPQLSSVTARRTWTVHSSTHQDFLLPTPRPPFRVTIHVEPMFSPAEFGVDDTREIGAWVTFAFTPSR